ncbi:hypothetical protein AA0229_1792 [Gluconobacter cerinus NRIC 0229]|uniref:Uncharacterized protein n=1 Tax=Gluconobacter cerinus TaxID=38307 RepID=A0AAV5NAP6_9PROT|nr:hypothetical protein AA0229_1792 [Gluconobacter cerinus NRIC 0229]GLQ61463.1 hypothetical protein GCM10007867_03080 [Gluconobacter cerinus]
MRNRAYWWCKIDPDFRLTQIESLDLTRERPSDGCLGPLRSNDGQEKKMSNMVLKEPLRGARVHHD